MSSPEPTIPISPAPVAPKSAGRTIVRVVILVVSLGAMAWAGLSIFESGPSNTWLKELRDGDEEGRRIAATNLNRPDVLPAVAIPALCDSLAGDNSAEVRFEVARILGAMGDASIRRGDKVMLDRVLNSLTAAFKDENPKVRLISLTMIPVLAAAAATPSEDETERAQIADPAALVAKITEALPDPEENVQIAALIALGYFPNNLDPALPMLMKLATSYDPSVKPKIRTNASSALRKIKVSKSSVPMLVESIKSPEPRVRYISAVVLSQAGPEAVDAIPALIEILKGPAGTNDREDPGRPAATALGSIAPGTPRAEEAITALKAAKESSENRGRTRAIDTAIAKFEEKKTP